MMILCGRTFTACKCSNSMCAVWTGDAADVNLSSTTLRERRPDVSTLWLNLCQPHTCSGIQDVVVFVREWRWHVTGVGPRRR